jgi:hypothetical protein
MKKYFFLPVLFLFASCAGTSPASNDKTGTNEGKKTGYGTTEETGKDDAQKVPAGDKISYRLIVSFYSKGEGPDSKAMDICQTYISDYETRNRLKVSYDKIGWGREGEVDYCFHLDNLGPDAQSSFIIQLRELLIQSQLVHIDENTVSIHSH